MLKYFLKASGSDNNTDLVYFDESSIFDLTEYGYTTASYSTSSMLVSPTSGSTGVVDEIYSGDLYGTAKLTELKINGIDFYDKLSTEKFGYLHYDQTNDTNSSPGEGYFRLNQNVNTVWNNNFNGYTAPTEIVLSLSQTVGGFVYSSHQSNDKFKHYLNDIIENNISNSYVLLESRDRQIWKKFKIVSSSAHEITSSSAYAKFSIEEVESYIPSSSKYTSISSSYYAGATLDDEIQFTLTQITNIPTDTIFDIEIIKGTDTTLTGDFSGSFTGTANLTGAFTGILNGTASFAQLANSKTIEVYETSSTWTKPSWAKSVKVVLIGGGGGGGGSYGPGAYGVTGGGGGAGGSLVIGEFDAQTLPTSSISITVGAGGFGGVGLSDGMNGGTSYFGDYLFSPGGKGGEHGLLNAQVGTYVNGGFALPSQNFMSTGGGPGGKGSIDGILDTGDPRLPYLDVSNAPSLPIHPIYLQLNWNETQNIPAAIAPTGGGGGLGFDGTIHYTSYTPKGGFIRSNTYLGAGDTFPITYGLVGSDWGYENGKKFYPGHGTKIGLGGMGGYSGSAPTNGTSYGGGGGGAYGGGDISYLMGMYDNYGGNGANGVVVIISEA
jgi:hypothetical protein